MQGDFKERKDLSLNEFCGCIRTGISRRLEDADVTVQEVIKNNGIKLHGLVITEKGSNISPTIYLEQFYEQYQSGMVIGRIENIILDIYRRDKPPACFDESSFLDWNQAKENIGFKIISVERNKEFLKGVPYLTYLDLAVIFSYYLVDSELGRGNITIHNNHVERWGVKIEDLYEVASANTFRLMKPIIKTMEECLGFKTEDSRGMPLNILPMYVLYNNLGVNGAVGILNKEILKEFSDKVASDFYILPSSIHEIILLPLLGSLIEDEKGLSKIVQAVNSEKLFPDEVLSDNAYKYIRETGEIVILREGDSNE